MAKLVIETNLGAPDDFYEALLEMHRGLDASQSAMVNARLILLLANHVGDLEVLRDAMRRARADFPSESSGPEAASAALPKA